MSAHEPGRRGRTRAAGSVYIGARRWRRCRAGTGRRCTSGGDGRSSSRSSPSGLLYPLINHYFLAEFSLSVFPLPIPDDTVMTFMTIFAIMAIGLNIVAGFAGLLDLGYVAFYAIGAYVAAFLASPHCRRSGSTSMFLGRGRRERAGRPPPVLGHRADRR